MIKKLLLSTILLLVFTGCSPKDISTNYPVSSAPIQGMPYPGYADTLAPRPSLERLPAPLPDAPPPRRGKASISGVLYSFTLPHVLGKTLFYLIPAVGKDQRQMPTLLIGPDDKRGDIRGYTDTRGLFTLDDILPGNYYLIVGVTYNWIPAVISETDETPRLIELGVEQRKPLGIVYVPWP